jgi:GT2 family glycosyltransferase
MRVDIIVPSYVIDQEAGDHCARFLETLKQWTPRELYRLIIIDNGSRFRVEEMKESADEYIRKDYPLGYGRASNLGMAFSDAELMVVCNNDITFNGPWLEKLIEEYEKHGPGVLSPVDHPEEYDICHDANWFSLFMLNRKTFIDVGYFDETLNYRFMDQDYSIRCKQKGYNVMRTGKVLVGHVNEATWSKQGNGQEEREERQRMIDRYGVALFSEYARR